MENKYCSFPAEFVSKFTAAQNESQLFGSMVFPKLAKLTKQTARDAGYHIHKMEVLDILYYKNGHWSHIFIFHPQGGASPTSSVMDAPYPCIIHLDSSAGRHNSEEVHQIAKQVIATYGKLTKELPLETLTVAQQQSDYECGYRAMLYSCVIHEFVWQGGSVTMKDKLENFRCLNEWLSLITDEMVDVLQLELTSFISLD
jgi:hypothetical protein